LHSASAFSKILPLRQRAEVRNRWLKHRLDDVLPKIMTREGFDMWIVVAREYNEDPVIMTLLPEPAMSARRRTILLFYLRGDGTLERLTLARSGMGDLYQAAWDPSKEEQHACLGRLVRERNPRSIGIDVSETFAFGDGLTHSEYNRLAVALGTEYMARARGAERLAVGWLEHRTQQEIDVYPGIVEISHAIIAEAFSSRVIQPGVTTTEDVVWWMRQRVHDLGLQSWFQPSISIQAAGQVTPQLGAAPEGARKLILPGDLLHCDFGIRYLGLATDNQQHAYVLKLGEDDAPEGLKAALATGNRLQDIVVGEFSAGRTGNQILMSSLSRAKGEGINASIYCHPIGYHGHAAGTLIGLWDTQQGVPGQGDYELFDNTCHAIELNIRQAIPEWGGQEVRIALEEDAVFTGGAVYFLDNRQTKLHLVG